MKTCHLSPTFIFWRASVQPAITPLTGNSAGWPRLIRAVELGAVDQGASVVGDDRVFQRGGLAGARLEHLVLEAAGQGGDARLGLVGGEEILARLQVLLGVGSSGSGPFGGGLLGHQLLLELGHGLDDLLLGQGGLAGHAVLEPLGQEVGVDLDALFLHAPGHVQADRVGNLLFKRLQLGLALRRGLPCPWAIDEPIASPIPTKASVAYFIGCPCVEPINGCRGRPPALGRYSTRIGGSS